MSELSAAIGKGYEIVHKGKTYTFTLIGQNVKLSFADRCYSRAREAVKELRNDVSSDEFAKMMSLLAEANERGEFELFGIRGAKAMASIKGAMLMVRLLTGCDEEEGKDLVENNTVEVKLIIDKVIEESFPEIVKKNQKVK